MDKPLSRAIKKVQQKKKLSEVNQTMMDVAKGAQTLATVAMKAAKGEKGGAEADRMRRTHMIATKRTMTASYNFGIDEAAPLTALAKGAIMVSKAATKAGAKGAKVATKGAAKGTKKAMSTADRMSAAFKKNKGLIDKKQGLPSNKMANSGKKEIDPSKNTTTNKKEKPKSTGLPSDSKSRDIGKDVDQNSAEKRKNRLDQKNKDKAQSLKKNTGRVVKKTGDMAKSAISTTSKAFGASSFAKEAITFKDYLNKL